MATKEQLLEGIDVRELPATRLGEDEYTNEPLESVEIGDLVAVYSRGYTRVAKVLAVTPKRVTVAYTTAGAWSEAKKTHEHILMRSPEREAAQTRVIEGKNYDFYVRESDAATAQFARASAYQTEEQAERERAKKRAVIEAETRDEYVDRMEAEAVESLMRAQDRARKGGVTQYVSITTKNVKRDEVFGLVGTHEVVA